MPTPYQRFLLKNKALRSALFGRFLSFRLLLILGLQMQTTIVSYLLYQLTNDVLSLGKLGLWEAVPAIGLSLFSGHFVDNKEKKSLLQLCTVGYLLLSVYFAALAHDSVQSSWGVAAVEKLIYAGVFLGGVLRSFAGPSSFSLLGLLLPRRLYANGTQWSSTMWQFGSVLGPLLGGAFLAWMGTSLSLWLVVVLIALALVIILRIPKQELLRKTSEPVLQSIKQGLKFLFQKQVLISVLALDMLAVLFGGAVALLPVYARDILQVGETGFGWLRAAPGIGSIITMIGISFLPLKTNPGIKLLLCIVGFGVTTIVFGVSTHFLLSFMMLLAGGMFDAISVVIRGTVLQLYTPDAMRGRISAINTMFISSSNELGAAESGLTAKWMGTVPAVVFGGIMTCVIAGITYLKAPKLRTLSLASEEKP